MKGYSTEDKAIVEITDVLRKAIHKKREERKKKKGSLFVDGLGAFD